MKRELHLEDDDIRRICSPTMAIFVQSMTTLETKIDLVCQKFEMDRRQCGQLLRHYPQIMCLSLRNISETVDYITVVMGRSHQELLRAPSLLWTSVDARLRPRHERLRAMNFPVKDYSLSTLYGIKDVAFERLLERQME